MRLVKFQRRVELDAEKCFIGSAPGVIFGKLEILQNWFLTKKKVWGKTHQMESFFFLLVILSFLETFKGDHDHATNRSSFDDQRQRKKAKVSEARL